MQKLYIKRKLPPMKSDFMKFLEENAKIVASWPKWKRELFHRSDHRNLDHPDCEWCIEESLGKLKNMINDRLIYLDKPKQDFSEFNQQYLDWLYVELDSQCKEKIKKEVLKNLEKETENQYNKIFKLKE